MPRTDWTITLSMVVQLVSIVAFALGAWFIFKTKVELLMKQQADQFVALTKQFHEHETDDTVEFRGIQSRLTDLVGVVQRLVGQNEAMFRRTDRP